MSRRESIFFVGGSLEAERRTGAGGECWRSERTARVAVRAGRGAGIEWCGEWGGWARAAGGGRSKKGARHGRVVWRREEKERERKKG